MLRVKELREDAGKTQEALAYESHISLRTLARIEAGADTNTKNLRKLAKVLGVSMPDLFEPNGKRKAKR